MNPEERACSRPDGPDCQFLVSARSWWCTNRKCIQERGTSIPGIRDCPYYKPVGETHEEILEELQGGFWGGAMLGVLMGVIVLIIFSFIMLLGKLL